MDQWGDELKKVFQAGLGAVATGMEKTQEVIEKLSRKGEPLYEQARKTVTDTAEKVKQAVSECGKTKASDVIAALRELTAAERAQVRDALDALEAGRQEAEVGADPDGAEEPAPDDDEITPDL